MIIFALLLTQYELKRLANIQILVLDFLELFTMRLFTFICATCAFVAASTQLSHSVDSYVSVDDLEVYTCGFVDDVSRRGASLLSTDNGGAAGVSPTIHALRSVESGEVYISEVMANPKGLTALPQTEYVEVKSNCSFAVSLQGWSFVYDEKVILIEDNYVLQPYGFAVLYKADREIYVAPPSVAVGLKKFPVALANTGKAIALKDPDGRLIDRFAYPSAKQSVSWERSLDAGHRLCSDPKGGTPGAPNSEETGGGRPDVNPSVPTVPDIEDVDINPGDIVFNELLPEPHNGGSEYIELYNNTRHPIPLGGLAIAIRKAGGTLGAYPLSALSSAVIKGEGYVVLTSKREGVADFYTLLNPDVLHEVKLPILNNVSSTLLLIDTRNGGQVIDEVAYNAAWHSPLIKNRKGVALERINPMKEGQNSANWTSASSPDYGTPGSLNSQFSADSGNGNIPAGISAPVLAEDGRYRIDYDLDKPGYGCRAYIYDLSGHRVAEILNSEILGTSGFMIWDMQSLGNLKLRSGIYIFYVELYHLTGILKHYKKPFFVK